MTGALVALSWVSEPAVAETPSAAASWETMTQCAGIADADVRHACTDEVLRKAGLLTSTPSSVQSQAKPAAQPSSPVSAQSSPQPPVQSSSTPPAPPAKTAALPAPAPQASFGQDRTREEEAKELKRIEVTLEKADKAGDGKLVLTTTDGVVWRQIDSDTTMPTPNGGESMRVWKNVLGGYRCRVGKWPPFRCKRVS